MIWCWQRWLTFTLLIFFRSQSQGSPRDTRCVRSYCRCWGYGLSWSFYYTYLLQGGLPPALLNIVNHSRFLLYSLKPPMHVAWEDMPSRRRSNNPSRQYASRFTFPTVGYNWKLFRATPPVSSRKLVDTQQPGEGNVSNSVLGGRENQIINPRKCQCYRTKESDLFIDPVVVSPDVPSPDNVLDSLREEFGTAMVDGLRGTGSLTSSFAFHNKTPLSYHPK